MSDHFDEVAAMRRFPTEDEWLDLPLPDEFADGDSGDGDTANRRSGDRSRFVDRVLAEVAAERAAEQRLAELDEELPSDLLQAFEAPEPSAEFVARTAAKVNEDRRQRWQELLARYVAPEPSPQFVTRTLAALREEDGDADEPAAGRRAAGRRVGGGSLADGAPTRGFSARGDGWRGRRGLFGLLAVAAALLLWFALRDDVRPPLEVRFADRAPTSVAYADAATPLSAVFAQVAEDEEPHALVDAPADGLWLLGEPASGEAGPGGTGEVR